MAGVKVAASRPMIAGAPTPFDVNINHPRDLGHARREGTQTAKEGASPPQKPDDSAAGPSYDEHSLARAAEKLEWSRKMHEKGYVSKGQFESDRKLYESLKARIDSEIALAQDRVDWAKRMFEKGYLSKSQYEAELLKHYDALKARHEGPAVGDDWLKLYDDLKQQAPALPAGPPADAASGGGIR
jgi:hypothetical protein